MNVRSRIISINLIEKIKLQPEYAEKIGVNLRIMHSSDKHTNNKENENIKHKLSCLTK